jgi:hypothetical protein
VIRKFLPLVSILTFLAACIPQSISNKSEAFPVTTPSQQTSTLPIDIDHEGCFWYGTSNLWTSLPTNGIWQELSKDESGYVQKTVFWREGYVALNEPNPALTVSGRRLDASAPTFSSSDATHGWDETGDFMLMGISIPTEGCWEITAEYQDTTLTYVIQVTP